MRRNKLADKPTDWGKIKFLTKCAAALVFASVLAECGTGHSPSPRPEPRDLHVVPRDLRPSEHAR